MLGRKGIIFAREKHQCVYRGKHYVRRIKHAVCRKTNKQRLCFEDFSESPSGNSPSRFFAYFILSNPMLQYDNTVLLNAFRKEKKCS